MSHIAIRKLFLTYESTREEVETAPDWLEQFEEELVALIKKYGLEGGDGYTGLYSLAKYSIARCENCRHWMINRDKNPIGLSEDHTADSDWAVRDGGFSDGKQLCEECLPNEHRWGHGF